MQLFVRYQAHPLSLFTLSSKPISQFRSFRFLTHASISRKPDLGTPEIEVDKLSEMKEKIENLGISCDFTSPGQYIVLTCPKCKGGRSLEKTLSFHFSQNKKLAMWRCFHMECGWADRVFADNDVNQANKLDLFRKTEESLRLEPLSHEMTAYFADRMISGKVLQKNSVMQLSTDQDVIAFTYKRNGAIINCKYRNIVNKRFWQEKGTEKILYGIDDIKDTDEIIIVEGEIDKLSMEQAGLANSVSVPDGAPQKLSTEELPSPDKASKIILATDGDWPGQVLAEELARRLGKKRCWLVQWPKKDESCCFKDANEVLKNLGPSALRDIINNAVLYQTPNFDTRQLK
ncbi:primase homolog protein isoform X2 [Daucus carota subsp. sativus]|uniref:primase homolog protein isoform X2 n=1 Tax=Daucus carota subsp. sativus TaxID=79200 RepID=UPI0007EF5C94|nr:PREDICTED: primase homolog protein isoform X2 [Daucus carota subsp. sativus]